jgi:hypothetical protein
VIDSGKPTSEDLFRRGAVASKIQIDYSDWRLAFQLRRSFPTRVVNYGPNDECCRKGFQGNKQSIDTNGVPPC